MGEFQIKRTQTGFVFHLKANNKQTVCTSQVYTSLSACKHGIESIRKNCGSKVEDQTLQKFEPMTNPKYELYLDKAGEYRFRLKASNGENILASQGYTTKSACKNGIESINNNAPDATVTIEDDKPVAKEAKPAAKSAAKPAAKKADAKSKAAKSAAKKPAAKPATKKTDAKPAAKKTDTKEKKGLFGKKK